MFDARLYLETADDKRCFIVIFERIITKDKSKRSVSESET